MDGVTDGLEPMSIEDEDIQPAEMGSCRSESVPSRLPIVIPNWVESEIADGEFESRREDGLESSVQLPQRCELGAVPLEDGPVEEFED